MNDTLNPDAPGAVSNADRRFHVTDGQPHRRLADNVGNRLLVLVPTVLLLLGGTFVLISVFRQMMS